MSLEVFPPWGIALDGVVAPTYPHLHPGMMPTVDRCRSLSSIDPEVGEGGGPLGTSPSPGLLPFGRRLAGEPPDRVEARLTRAALYGRGAGPVLRTKLATVATSSFGSIGLAMCI
jgi:hypothetical protein